MNLTDLFYSFPPRRALAIAIGLAIVLYALAANLAWTNQKRRTGRIGRWLASMQIAWLPRALGELARWLYYLGLPYATLMAGYSSVRALGVWNVAWLGGLPSAVILGIGSASVFIWVWRPYTRTEHPHAIDESRWSWARRIIELIYQQTHWAFYRSGPILWLNDFYWGSFWGLGLTLIEGWSNPSVRAGVRDITRADAPLWTGSLAIVSTIIFVFTQNFWYCLTVHLLLDLGLRAVIGLPIHAPGEESATHLERLPP